MNRRVVIFKYELRTRGETKLLMPVFAKVIAVQNQREKLVLWAECRSFNDEGGDHTGATGYRTFHSLLTGFHTEIPKKAEHVGTVQFDDGAFVAHVYEAKS